MFAEIPLFDNDLCPLYTLYYYICMAFITKCIWDDEMACTNLMYEYLHTYNRMVCHKYINGKEEQSSAINMNSITQKGLLFTTCMGTYNA